MSTLCRGVLRFILIRAEYTLFPPWIGSARTHFGRKFVIKLCAFSQSHKLFRYRKLRVWWFHAVVYSTFIFSGWCIYISWISEEDRPVLLCIPPTALTKDVNMIRSSVGTTITIFESILISVGHAEQLLRSCSVCDHTGNSNVQKSVFF